MPTQMTETQMSPLWDVTQLKRPFFAIIDLGLA